MKKKYKILGVTLARGGSKGVKNKNIRNFNGKPLIYHTIKEALKVKKFTDYIVSTDSIKIKNISEKLGADCPFLRPKNISNDRASSVEALIHAVNFCEKKNKIKYDFIIELMVTNPFKSKIDINNCINILINKKVDSVIGVNEVTEHHPARIKKIKNGYIHDFCIKEEFFRRQDLKPKAFIRNGSIYALKRKTLMVNKKRFGSKKSIPYQLIKKNNINIDSLLDFKLAEYMYYEK